MDWKTYQKRAAEFFASLGMITLIEERVTGVRGVHKIDVYVEGSFYGIKFKWVIECKAWKDNVTKEKVMALASIIQDIGADRGFLLSEKGFQSGAIRATAHSNIVLTSLADLRAMVNEELSQETLASLTWRLTKVRQRLRALKQQSDKLYAIVLPSLGDLNMLDLVIEDAVHGVYPNIYKVEDNVRYSADTFEELVAGVDEIISRAEAVALRYEASSGAEY